MNTGASLLVRAHHAHIGRFGAEQCQRLRALVLEHFPDLAPPE
ncbi:hypothetical protein [uncultured Zoogloea sp.]|nr:hypothetical protein [uncultured Zoogloea sp.]